jgi:hypothetical protein
MDKMNVVTFRATSHVLGAAVRASQPDKPLTIADVAASGILVRRPDEPDVQALIDSSQLHVAQVDYDSRVFHRPQLFAVVGGRAEQQTLGAVAVTAALSGTQVTVTLPAVTTGAIEAFVHVSGGALTESLVRAVPIANGASNGSAALILGSGDYTIVVLVPGYATALVTDTLP